MKIVTCNRCGGTGEEVCEYCAGSGYNGVDFCPVCDGEKHEVCQTCWGTGECEIEDQKDHHHRRDPEEDYPIWR